MDIERFEAKVLQEVWLCPVEECEGEMERVGGRVLASTSYPPQYPHRCNKCGHEKYSAKEYPKTIFRRKD